MHWLVPFAAPLTDAGRSALKGLSLANLPRLLAQAEETARDEGDEWSLSPPHERAWARAAGWAPVDGCVPLAAQAAAERGWDGDAPGWGLLTAVHARLGTEQVSLMDPALLALAADEDGTLDAMVRDVFASEGFEPRALGEGRWLCRHTSLDGLPTASLDRVVGRNVDRWLGADPRARLARRLQIEMQMLLHDHPLNYQREADGRLGVNSVWLSGTGPLPHAAPDGMPVLDDRLRRAALAEDWAAWAAAWQALDAGPLAEALARAGRGETVTLTLCGERSALTWQTRPRGALARWWPLRPVADVAQRLEAL